MFGVSHRHQWTDLRHRRVVQRVLDPDVNVELEHQVIDQPAVFRATLLRAIDLVGQPAQHSMVRGKDLVRIGVLRVARSDILTPHMR